MAYQESIRQNLEFIADSKVVQNGIDKKQYQYLLLKVMGVPQYNIATNFNLTSLKKRIAMMNKMRTARVHLIKFLFVLPLVAVMLLSFRNKIVLQSKKALVVLQSPVQDTIPARTVLPAKPEFQKKVRSVVTVNDQLTVTLKDGTKEKYNLNNPEEKALFEKKYGPLPEPPTPPDPPAPPAPPVVPALPANVSDVHIINNKVTIKLKSGKVERYDLDKPGEKAIFEKRYDDITPTLPKAPTAPLAPVAISIMTDVSVEPTIKSDVVEPVTMTANIINIQPALDVIHSDEKEMIAEISNQTTSGELTLLKKKLLVQGYKLKIGKINYNNGILQSLEGTISDFDSKSRFVGDDFSKLIITKLVDKNGKSGFNIRIFNGSVRM